MPMRPTTTNRVFPLHLRIKKKKQRTRTTLQSSTQKTAPPSNSTTPPSQKQQATNKIGILKSSPQRDT